MQSAVSSRTTSHFVLSATASTGLLAIVVGSFLPWLRSGSVGRNSYESAGLTDHFALVDNDFLSAMLHSWIVVPAMSAICVALYALGLDRVASALTLAMSALVGTTSGAVSVQAIDPAGLVGITPVGPATSLSGAVMAVIGALGVLVTAGRARTTADGRAGNHS